MNIKIEEIDMEQTADNWPEGQPFRPALVRNRKKDKHKWVVLSAPLADNAPPAWNYTEHDEFIRIPLFPYRLNGQAHLAMAYMLQLGLSCAGFMPKRVTDLYIVVGNPVELFMDDMHEKCVGMRYWIGFAVLTEDV